MRFLVADDHPLVRSGLKQILQTEFQGCRVDETSTGAEIIGLLESALPPFDLLLLDYFMPGSSDGELISLLHSHYPELRILVLSACQESAVIHRCLALGARGYVSKHTTHDAMLGAIRHLLNGGIYEPPELLMACIPGNEAEMTEKVPPVNQDMTPRQQDVLALLSDGLSNKAISRKLNLSENTIKVHVTAILRALHVNSRIQAVIVAQQMNSKNHHR